MTLIQLQGVSKTFSIEKDHVFALKNINLEIQSGEFVAITGPSGSGKSTLMNILGLLDQPTAGQYSLEGNSIELLSDNERSQLRNQKIGFVFQSFNLLPRASALRNVEMPLVYSASYDRSFSKDKIRALAIKALQKVSLEDRMAHKPNELSGGQKQRVAIARALVNKPTLVFADEPTGNLDSKTGKEILALFEDLNRKGATILLVTHDPHIATFSKRRISMLDGEIIEDSHAV
jgi:putative ABC transport system ATP-binding protein